MPDGKTRVNLIFGSAVATLAATALYFMYVNRDLPAIREAPQAEFSPGSALPQDHPPIDGASRLALLEQTIRNDPENADHRTQLGNLHYDMGQYQKAIEAYEESLRLKPRNPSVETDMATCYHYLGQHDRALAIINRVLDTDPGFPQALFNKGVILQAGKKDVPGAIAAWEALLKREPNFPQKAELERRISELKSELR
jgi:tetratricopeptide (TPR) repeat protein